MYFKVRSFVNEHSCLLEEIHRRHRQASAVIIGEVVAPRLQQQDGRLMCPKDIIADMKTIYGIQIMYRASLRSFQRCMRPIIAVDGTHLKERFGGIIFVATSQDGNKQGSLGHIDDLVFISDRHASIEARISKVFPYATHTICCWHFAENVNKGFHRKDVAAIMDKAARAYTELKYNRYMEELRNLYKNAFDYVEVAGPHKWSSVHCLQRRNMLQCLFHDRHRVAQSIRHQLSDAAHLVILKRVEKCGYMTVNPVD
ncbi:hypothetical protein Dsin_030097 [Dipteronia sinensis]|uniref:Uncharacterized protein n=1 Tax=Dipteronia sinensis TaxID=43782 RepID=A0AAD9ZI23_9ROSI|nr:hypothetical protein Dsin_030097 [Dipteronia sinensis]